MLFNLFAIAFALCLAALGAVGILILIPAIDNYMHFALGSACIVLMLFGINLFKSFIDKREDHWGA